jgi:ketosteroid isomerase-like protein
MNNFHLFGSVWPMRAFRVIRIVAVLLFLAGLPWMVQAESRKVRDVVRDVDREALRKTSEAIRAAFFRGDADEVLRYHHPEVKKALSFQNVLIGREAVAADLRRTLQHFHLEWVENNVESLLVEGDTAVEQTQFAIKGTPLQGGEPFLFKGRAMVVYVRYKGSPTGWASIREIIQPATP